MRLKKRRLRPYLSYLLFFFVVFMFVTSVLTLFVFRNTWFNKSKYVSPLSVLITSQKYDKSGDIRKELIGIGVSPLSVVATDEGYLIKVKEGEKILFSKDIDIATQISSLQLVLSRLTIEGKRFSRLDFRFEKPVVTFK